MFSLESPHRGDSNKYTQYTTFIINKRAMMALGRSPEYHWNQIISKYVDRFSRRSRLKLFFLFLALAAILFNRAERFL